MKSANNIKTRTKILTHKSWCDGVTDKWISINNKLMIAVIKSIALRSSVLVLNGSYFSNSNDPSKSSVNFGFKQILVYAVYSPFNTLCLTFVIFILYHKVKVLSLFLYV